MAIDFPCLQKDISFWSPANTQANNLSNATVEIAKSLERTLNLNGNLAGDGATVARPKSNNNMDNWLEKQTNKNDILNGDRNSVDSRDFNIMSPVLKDTPTSIWLANKKEDVIKDEREADLTTSIWLATSSNEPFTCVTRSTNDAAAIQWPDILFQKSPNVWLLQQRVGREDVDQWLSKKMIESTEESSMTESVFDSWIKCQDGSKTWNMDQDLEEADQTVETIYSKWIEKGSVDDMESISSKIHDDSFLGWLVPGRSEALQVEQDSIGSDAKSYIEKWLCLAANDDPEVNETVTNDDESSIAILNYGDEEQTDNDFDMIHEEESNAAKFWLF